MKYYVQDINGSFYAGTNLLLICRFFKDIRYAVEFSSIEQAQKKADLINKQIAASFCKVVDEIEAKQTQAA